MALSVATGINLFPHDKENQFTLDEKEYTYEFSQFAQALRQTATPFPQHHYLGHMNYDISIAHQDALRLAIKYNQNNVAAESSYPTSLMELELIEQFKKLIGYSDTGACGYVSGGGTAGNIMGLWVARDKARAEGNLANIVLTSQHAHYSIRKACKLLGLELRLMPSDDHGGMTLPPVLPEKLLAIVATIGTTEFGTIDRIPIMEKVAALSHVWLHIDAAYGGYFAYARKYRDPIFDYMKYADSITIDMHKMGYAPYVASAFLLRDAENRKFVSCDDVPYIDMHVSSSWTLEGSRSGALIASAAFGHKILEPKYPVLMDALLEGARTFKQLLASYPDEFTVIEPTDLTTVIYTMKPDSMMPYFKGRFATNYRDNIANKHMILVTTEHNGHDVFRAVVMNPNFPSYVNELVKQIRAERLAYIASYEAFVEQRVTALMSVAQEVDTKEDLIRLVKSGRRFTAYNGFEPSGKMHIAQALTTVLNANVITRNGGKMIIYIADWFAQLNHKMGGNLDKITDLGRYFIEIFKSLGIDCYNTEFVWASRFINSSTTYLQRTLDISSTFSVQRINRCTQIMGRGKDDELTESQHIYPCMQCADVFELGAGGIDICQLGLDQRKVNMLAREYAEKKKLKMPIILSHHMLMGLKYKRPKSYVAPTTTDGKTEAKVDAEDRIDPKAKMSKSIPDSAIFMDDSRDEIIRKMMGAFCDDDPNENPVFEYLRYIVLRWYGKVELFGHTYTNWEDIAADFAAMDKKALKLYIADAVDAIVDKVRRHFASSTELRELSARIDTYRATR